MFVHYINLKKILTKGSLGFLLSLFLIVLPAEGKKLIPKLPSSKNPLSLEIQTEYYHSTENYTELGKFSPLPATNYFLYNIQDFTLDYSPWKWFSAELFLSVGFGQSQTRQVELKNFNLIESGFGFSILQQYGSFFWNWDFKGSFPLAYNPPINDLVIIGDGAYYAETGMWFIYGVQPRFLYVFTHSRLRYRTNELSSLLFNQIGVFIRATHLQFGVSADVFFSAPLVDNYSQSPKVRWDITDRVNGGSYKFLSINPNALSFSTWLKWKVRPVSLMVYANRDTYGARYGKGFTIAGNLTFTFNTKSNTSAYLKKRRRRSRRKISNDNGYFSEESEGGSNPNLNSELQKEINQLK